MPRTSVRSSSIVKLIESAIAPVTSSVTDACTVRSPSARLPISFSSRRIASWLRLFSPSLSNARTRASSRNTLPSSTRHASASSAKTIAAHSVHARRSPSYASASLRRVVEQRLGLVVDAARRLLGDDQPRHVGRIALTPARRRRSASAARPAWRAPRRCARRQAQRVAALQSPFRMSRNVPVSLPSRNATSGSISSDDASALAFFAIRCDSTASWFAYSISRRLPPPARSARRLLRELEQRVVAELSASRPLASEVRLVSLSTGARGASTRSQRALTSFSSLSVASSCVTSRLTPRTCRRSAAHRGRP